jgi:hypothetical protein
MLQQSKRELTSHTTSQFFIVATTQNQYLHEIGSEKIAAIFALVDLLTFEYSLFICPLLDF